MNPLHILAGAVLLACTVPTPAGASSTQPMATVLGVNKGYDAMFNGSPAGNYRVRIEGVDSVAYCADQTKPLHSGQSFSVVSLAESNVPNAGKAAWVALNHTGIGAQLPDANLEAAAVQIAMWRFTNNSTIDAVTVPDADVRARAAALVAAVGDNAVTSSPASYQLTLEATSPSAGAVSFTAKLTTRSGAAIAGEDVVITTGSTSQTVRTDAEGKATIQSSYTPGSSASAQARHTGTIPVGAVLVPEDGSQPLMVVNPVQVESNAAATVSVMAVSAPAAPPAAPVVSTTTAPPTPTTVAEEAPTLTEAPAAPEEELPHTGVLEHAMLRLLIGLGAFAVGMAGLMAHRRRAITR